MDKQKQSVRPAGGAPARDFDPFFNNGPKAAAFSGKKQNWPLAEKNAWGGEKTPAGHREGNHGPWAAGPPRGRGIFSPWGQGRCQRRIIRGRMAGQTIPPPKGKKTPPRVGVGRGTGFSNPIRSGRGGRHPAAGQLGRGHTPPGRGEHLIGVAGQNGLANSHPRMKANLHTPTVPWGAIAGGGAGTGGWGTGNRLRNK